MKTLLLLPLILLLTACANDLSDEEKQVAEQREILEQSIEVFRHNESMIEDVILYGEICLLHVEETGKHTGEACEMYYLTQDTTNYLSQEGVKLVFVLMHGGLLVKDSPYFVEIVEIVERLAIMEKEAKQINTKIDSFRSSQCIKCVM